MPLLFLCSDCKTLLLSWTEHSNESFFKESRILPVWRHFQRSHLNKTVKIK